MAHTAKRQVRCAHVELHNGAVYMELLIRNSPLGCLSTSTWAFAIEATILAPLRNLPQGQLWLVACAQRTRFTIPDEVTHWTDHSIQYWLYNMQNLYHDGISDSISIRNALGNTQSIRTKTMSLLLWGVASWSTVIAHIGAFNDLLACQLLGCSLIRQANNSVDALGIRWVHDVLAPGWSPGIMLVQQVIGPFTAIDNKWVVIPPTVLRFIQTWQEQMYPTLTTHVDFATITTVDPVTLNWTQDGTQFYGSNPMCPYGTPQLYVQPSFGCYDDCATQVLHTIDLTGVSVLFATLWMSSTLISAIPQVCHLCHTTTPVCTRALLQVQNSSSEIEMDVSNVTSKLTREWMALNISFMQMANRNGIDFVLTQPLIDISYSDPWTFYGWVMVYEWLVGQREVYSFDGDEGSVTLMSQAHPSFTMAANALELPQNACTYISFVSVYVTFVLCSVGLLVLMYAVAVGFDFDGVNLFQFNRVVGSVWVDRPILFVRCMTALFNLAQRRSHLRLSTASLRCNRLRGPFGCRRLWRARQRGSVTSSKTYYCW
ncbi:Aste57867_12582 [Aphanomyces stellatus]|uniref:Aste57867_12582 protein n=1 Tax=Aphanomyces stellatus TaxID=120398 RepID=A0A485KW07_9STRA|nr:hypothetical protein As57867_012536 [Aphanomyces stellatus]VFT89433.1 Aste57867_12582 [Aphanomyces stellatus]